MIATGLVVWHATVLEIAWTVIGLVGVFVGYGNLSKSAFNLKSLKTMNGHSIERFTELRILAAGQWRNDLFRLSKSSIITCIGIVACVTPPVSNTAPTISPVAVAVTIGLFAIEILILLASIMDRMQRDMLYNYDDHNH